MAYVAAMLRFHPFEQEGSAIFFFLFFFLFLLLLSELGTLCSWLRFLLLGMKFIGFICLLGLKCGFFFCWDWSLLILIVYWGWRSLVFFCRDWNLSALFVCWSLTYLVVCSCSSVGLRYWISCLFRVRFTYLYIFFPPLHAHLCVFLCWGLKSCFFSVGTSVLTCFLLFLRLTYFFSAPLKKVLPFLRGRGC